MRTALAFFLGLIVLLAPTDAYAWLVPCDGNDLPRCKTACENAGGTILTNPNDGSKWCKIPYRVRSNSSDANATILKEGGFDLSKGSASFPATGSTTSPSSY